MTEHFIEYIDEILIGISKLIKGCQEDDYLLANL